MRIKDEDIIMDDEIDIDKNEISGYMWATDKLCEIANYKGELGTEDFINLYPTYNIKEKRWYVWLSKYENNIKTDEELELTYEEIDIIRNKFIKHYFEEYENWYDYLGEINEWIS